MNRALSVLTGAALVVLLLGLQQAEHVPATVVLGVVLAGTVTLGFSWVQRRSRAVAAGYFAVALALGYVLFGVAGGSTGVLLMLVVLVIQAVLLLPLPWAAVVTALVPLVHVGMSWSDGLRNGADTLVAAVFAAVLTTLHVREQRARAELAEVNAQLRRYAAQAEELATTRERNRMARDIHDGLGHHLTVVQMQLQAAGAVLDTDRARAVDLLEKAQRQSREALADVRRSVATLREPRAGAALPDALHTLATESTEAGVATAVEVLGPERDLPSETEESLYRVAQEGLTNVRKHARAASARVVLDYGSAGTVRVEVRDDGQGAPGRQDGPSGYGLTGLRERVTGLGGRLSVDSAPGKGLALSAELPG